MPRGHAVVVSAKGKKKGQKRQEAEAAQEIGHGLGAGLRGDALRQLRAAPAGRRRCWGIRSARTGKPLDASLAGAGDLPKALYKAPVCVMVVSDDEKIAYANDAACEFAGKKHTELIGSATTLPATVADGYDSSYEKKLDGNTMQKAKRWAISKMAVVDGELVTEDQGVGYAFEAWVRDADGALCKPGGIVEAPPIDPAEIQAKIDAQAAACRPPSETSRRSRASATATRRSRPPSPSC